MGTLVILTAGTVCKAEGFSPLNNETFVSVVPSTVLQVDVQRDSFWCKPSVPITCGTRDARRQERRESRCFSSFPFLLHAPLKRINLCCANFLTAECKQKTACLISICPLLCKCFSRFPANSMFLQLLTCSPSLLCNYEPMC